MSALSHDGTWGKTETWAVFFFAQNECGWICWAEIAMHRQVTRETLIKIRIVSTPWVDKASWWFSWRRHGNPARTPCRWSGLVPSSGNLNDYFDFSGHLNKCGKGVNWVLPSQAVIVSSARGIVHLQIGRYRETRKNGVQQATKVPKKVLREKYYTL